MSFRRAQLILILIILAIAAVVAILVQNQVDTPWIITFVAAVILVGGFTLHVLSQNTEAVGSIQGWFQPKKVQDKPAAIPKLKLSPERQQQVRTTLLENVRLSIRDYFQEELHTVLGAYDLPKAYEPRRLRNATYQRPNQPNRSIPPDEPIITIFRQSQNALLILGDPGAGKTFTLTELARELVAAAVGDRTLPIPVVLNLSSWSPDTAFLDWLVEQLYLQYLLARNVGRAWVTAGQLTLLLDGLDEVAAGVRNACITAINDFRADYQVDLVVCSRSEEFERLTNDLHVANAVRIRPLEDEQIHAYLAEQGAGLEVVQSTIRNDPILRRLARTPLILNIIALAYDSLSPPQLAPLATIKARREHLYDTYLRGRLAHHPDNATYSREQAFRWLHWLAQRMDDLGLQEFYVEHLQANWLPQEKQQRRYSFKVGLVVGLAGGLASGMIFGLVFGLVSELASGMVFGLVVGLAFALLNGWFSYRSEIQLAETLHWSWPSIGQLFVVVSFGLVVRLIFGLVGEPVLGLVFGLASGLIIGLVFVLTSSEIAQRSQPNQGIHRSRQTAKRIALARGLISGLTLVPVGALVGGPVGGLVGGLSVGLSVGLSGGLVHGGDTVIKHVLLRRALARHNYLPYDLVPYLDHMARLILLRRVGGGYRFIHRTMQEHIAALTPADIEFIAADAPLHNPQPNR